MTLDDDAVTERRRPQFRVIHLGDGEARVPKQRLAMMLQRRSRFRHPFC